MLITILLCQIVLLMISNIVHTEYDFLCPDYSQWKYKRIGSCQNNYSYFCLFDQNNFKYTQFCRRKPEFQRPGYKFVIRGSIDGEECPGNRFQPMKFWTNGSHDCIFEKSLCTEEGQVDLENGDSKTDRSCRCDYTKGFAFVKRPQNLCFCMPKTEDCSCYVRTCPSMQHILTPDYQCVLIQKLTDNHVCKFHETNRENKKIDDHRIPIAAKDNPDNDKQGNALIVSFIILGLIVLGSFTSLNWKHVYDGLIRLRKFNKRKKKSMQIQEKEKKYNKLQEQFLELRKQFNELPRMQNIERCIISNYKQLVSRIDPLPIAEALQQKNILSKEDMEEIKNTLKRTTRNHILLRKICYGNEQMYDVFTQTLRSNPLFIDLAEQMETLGFHDSKIVRNIDDLEEIENEKIPKTVQDTHRKHIEEWLINDKKFVETNASKNIAAALRSSNILFVVGRTGHGKTSVIRHAALNLSCKEGFEIIPDVADPNVITRFYQPGRKQIFVVDNIGGRDHINVKSVDLWSSSLQTIKLLVEDGLDCPGNTVCQHTKGLLKVLISCEKEIFDKTAFKDSNVLTDNICFLSDWEISVKERMEMIRKYSAIGDDFTNYNSFTDLEFPLLCRLTIGMSKSQIKAFFSNPLTHIRNEFENMQQNDKCKFFLITLCVVFQDGFAKDMINQCFQGNSTMLMNDLCNEFNFDTNNGKIHSRIMEKLNVLQQTYIHHENDRYSLIHKTIYTTAATVCGCRYFDFFISYGSCEFIGERYTLNAVTDKEDLIPIETEQKYFNRLLKDLEDGNTFSTFQNKQLDNHVYRHKFIDYFIKWGLKVREIMSKTNSFRRQSDELNNSKNSINITELSPLMQSAHKGYADVVLMLIELGCAINETDKDRRSPLYIAASCGRTEVVDVLLKNKADITLCDYMGRSPLYAASREGYDKIIEVLITVSEVDKCDDYGRFPLYVASEAGHIQVVELLLDNKAGISKTDKTGASPLFVATQRGQKRVVEYLVEKGADVNHCDNEGRSPLFVACEEKHTDLVKILLTHYAKQKFCDLHNRSPMYMASRAGNKEAVGLLLKENNNMINTYDDNGKTPLFVACELGHTDVVETILRYKPDVNLSNRLGLSPLHIACSKGHFKVIEILFLSRCDINKLDKDKRTPLYAACKAGHTDIVELLLDKKANFNICNKWGASVLFIACREGHLKVVECLLKTKPTMNRCNSNFSPLHKACEEGFEAIVKVLINKNSIINYRDENQKTPLHFACENGHANIVTLLRSLNAKSYKDIEGQLPIDLAKRNGHLSIVHLLED